MHQDQINSLAEKFAQLIASGSALQDISSFQESLDEINQRLTRLETASALSQASRPTRIPHSSQDRFTVGEAIVDGLFDRDAKEKTCTFEPNDRPCDHCSMCSARGF